MIFMTISARGMAGGRTPADDVYMLDADTTVVEHDEQPVDTDEPENDGGVTEEDSGGGEENIVVEDIADAEDAGTEQESETETESKPVPDGEQQQDNVEIPAVQVQDNKAAAEEAGKPENQVEEPARREQGRDKPTTGSGDGEPERKLVDFRADVMRPIKITQDSTALNLLGNVVMYHNGAVITCDSAVRYSERFMECYKRVIINQENTYIYGDRADYNGETNRANVYGPIIKVVDDSSVLYTYNFTFNTLDKVGEYYGTGTLTQGDNMMESERGYYYVDTREVVGVNDVQLSNPEYKMISDSVVYNLDTETAEFFTTTHVWNDKGEILIADRGTYHNATADYRFTSNAYILTETQEVWSDTLDYNSRLDNVVLRRNIQIRDEENHVTAFGDYGEYWGETEYGMLTLDPSVMSYDPGEPDTLYMRSDSMFFYTFDIDHVFETSMLPGARKTGGVATGEEEIIEEIIPGTENPENETDDIENREEGGEDGVNAEAVVEDADGEDPNIEGADAGLEGVENAEVAAVAADGDTKLSKADKKALKTEQKKREKEERKRKNAKAPAKEPEPAGLEGSDDLNGIDGSGDAGAENGNGIAADTAGNINGEAVADSTGLVPADFTGIVTDSLEVPVVSDSLALPLRGEGDTIQRVIFAYYNVRIFREDFQAVCDSLVAFSIDSTAHLYIAPVLWNENNQITSDIMDIYTRNEQVYKADFIENPFMAGQVDSIRYNQIKGKLMTAWFRDNEIYRHEVKGNGQTYYYMEDDEENPDGTVDLMGFLVAESADIMFLIEDRQMDKIIYEGDPVYTMYPMDKIPADQDQFLPGFKWESERRPAGKEDVCTRTERPSVRERVESIPQPQFPITEAIMTNKERMIQQGFWRERNDTLSPLALEYIMSIQVD